MAYIAGNPLLSVARQLTEGAAQQGQNTIPIPGGMVPTMNDVFVGGACLSQGDYDDSDGAQIKLTKAMNAGTQFRVVSYAPGQTVQPVGGQLAGFRNRLVNGDMRVAQYQSSVTNNAAGKVYGPYDRWATNTSTTGAVTAQFLAMPWGPFTRAGLQVKVVTVPTFTGNLFWQPVMQLLEGFDTYDLVGAPLTLSFLFQSNVAGLYSATLQDSGTQSCTMTFNYPVAGVTQWVSITFPTLPTSLTIPNYGAMGITLRIGQIGVGSAVSPTVGQWISGTTIIAANSVNWATAVNNYIAVAEVQLEAGALATAFERRPIQYEMSRCQRYYCKSYAYGNYAGTNTGLANGIIEATGNPANATIASIRFPVQMRTLPTVTVYDGAGVAGQVSVDGVVAGTSAGVSIDNQSENGFKVFAASHFRVSAHYTAQAEL